MKRRLDKLKKNIEEATAAVEQEREKNVSLLHLIFPPDIAKRLWLGKLLSSARLSHPVVFFRVDSIKTCGYDYKKLLGWKCLIVVNGNSKNVSITISER